jgi:hypothetical protein
MKIRHPTPLTLTLHFPPIQVLVRTHTSVLSMNNMQDSPDLPPLPKFDARDYQPPAWASSSKFQWSEPPNLGRPAPTMSSKLDHDETDSTESDEEEVWEDASEGVTLVDGLPEFTTAQLRASLAVTPATKG